MFGLPDKLRPFRILLAAYCFQLMACAHIDLYEKLVSVPDYNWKSSFKPQFKFVISDTTSPYQVYVVLRHNEKYNYNNIWLNLTMQAPGQLPQKFMLELPLATTEKGWLGTAMDDLIEHRIALTLDTFRKPGEYIFTIEQVMREDPLENVMNVGLRIEKKTQ
jgi:gliding motility-associated lipoprotein GldH